MKQYLNEYEAVGKVLADLKAIVQRENKRHQMDQHLVPGMLNLIENEIIPLLENEIDADPTPQFLYDETGGEPAISADEVHHAAWVQHQAMHS
jgi:hypothetical protein